ncbi:MAG: formylglycine-generating enzyme family protein [Chloroflexi bacterium]|nr:formylglycine-generating enzyme family protein [Chloroflexota bacterium]
MVYVPSGTFSMGSNDSSGDERPVHDVTLDAFWIDQTEVTNEQYELCVADGECEKSTYAGDSDFNGDQQPVVGVDWNDAEVYCTWVGGRLPTEAEWEYAARGPEGSTYPWGDNSPTCDLLNYWDDNACVGKTSAVGSYSSEGDSWVGASDMAGNVWEWVNDWYDSDYYANSSTNNPTGPSNGKYKVLRGGDWYSLADDDARSSYRNFNRRTVRNDSFGFRCAAPGI